MQDEPCPASLIVFGSKFAGLGAGEITRYGEAEARSAGRSPASGGAVRVGPVETLEDATHVLGCDSRPGVRNGHLDLSVRGTALHRYGAAGRSEAEGVIEEGSEDLVRTVRVAARKKLARVVDLEVLAFGGGAGGEPLRALGEDEGEVEGFMGDGDPFGVQTGQ